MTSKGFCIGFLLAVGILCGLVCAPNRRVLSQTELAQIQSGAIREQIRFLETRNKEVFSFIPAGDSLTVLLSTDSGLVKVLGLKLNGYTHMPGGNYFVLYDSVRPCLVYSWEKGNWRKKSPITLKGERVGIEPTVALYLSSDFFVTHTGECFRYRKGEWIRLLTGMDFKGARYLHAREGFFVTGNGDNKFAVYTLALNGLSFDSLSFETQPGRYLFGDKAVPIPHRVVGYSGLDYFVLARYNFEMPLKNLVNGQYKMDRVTQADYCRNAKWDTAFGFTANPDREDKILLYRLVDHKWHMISEFDFLPKPFFIKKKPYLFNWVFPRPGEDTATFNDPKRIDYCKAVTPYTYPYVSMAVPDWNNGSLLGASEMKVPHCDMFEVFLGDAKLAVNVYNGPAYFLVVYGEYIWLCSSRTGKGGLQNIRGGVATSKDLYRQSTFIAPGPAFFVVGTEDRKDRTRQYSKLYALQTSQEEDEILGVFDQTQYLNAYMKRGGDSLMIEDFKSIGNRILLKRMDEWFVFEVADTKMPDAAVRVTYLGTAKDVQRAQH